MDVTWNLQCDDIQITKLDNVIYRLHSRVLFNNGLREPFVRVTLETSFSRPACFSTGH